MKNLLLILGIVSLFLLTSCSDSNSIESYIESPKLSEQNAAIYEALEKSVGENIKLHYPRTGEHRSAFVLHDINDEPTQEAIVFYTNANKNSNKTLEIRVNILDFVNGKWVSIYDMVTGASQIDKIVFLKDESNNESFVIIGYTTINKLDNSFTIYHLNGNVLESIYSNNYSVLEVVDIDSDNKDDIILVSKGTSMFPEKGVITAKLLSYENEQFVISSEIEMAPHTLYYSNVSFGMISNEIPALFLDSFRGTNLMSTEVIISNQKGSIYNLTYNSYRDLFDITYRKNTIVSKDIDNDGLIEIPSEKLGAGYDNLNSTEQLYFTDWYTYTANKDSFDIKYSSYVNLRDSYCFIFPDRWGDKVTAKQVLENNEIIFYQYDGQNNDNLVELLTIKTVNRSEISANLFQDSYVEIMSSGQIIYMAKIADNIESDLAVSYDEILKNFKLYM